MSKLANGALDSFIEEHEHPKVRTFRVYFRDNNQRLLATDNMMYCLDWLVYHENIDVKDIIKIEELIEEKEEELEDSKQSIRFSTEAEAIEFCKANGIEPLKIYYEDGTPIVSTANISRLPDEDGDLAHSVWGNHKSHNLKFINAHRAELSGLTVYAVCFEDCSDANIFFLNKVDAEKSLRARGDTPKVVQSFKL